MAQAPGLQQVQKLALQQILAPQLQQSLHLLQVPALELNALVHEEMQQNPLLEETSKETPTLEVENNQESRTELPDDAKADDDFKREFEVLSKLDDEWREYFAQTNSFRGRNTEQEEQRQHFFDSIVQQESLQQHLLDQVDYSTILAEDRKTAELLIGSLNDDGYLITPVEELAINTGTPLDQLEKTLAIIQTFHPVGVGARNLKECLLIQLQRLGKSDSIEAAVVSQHLEDLARKRYAEISKAINLTVEQVQQVANFISTLEPKPGRMFSAEQQQYVAADVVVQKIEDKYVVMLNNDQVPHLRISGLYKELMGQQDKLGDAKEYIREKLRAGKFLIKCIHQRQQTIQNIAKVIVERQHDFLEEGLSKLHPLTMAQVAEVVGVHETTISRAVANKYIQTPQGLFEMKFFFTPGFQTTGGVAMSNASVKDQIAQLVEREDPGKPYSDQEIVAMLKEQGIPIARRTIAKYRDELNIPSSNLRKKF